MGKGRIISHSGNGLYEVELIKDNRKIFDKVTIINSSISTITENILPELDASKTAAESEKNTAFANMNTTIDNFISDLATQEEVTQAVNLYHEKLANYEKAKILLDSKTLELNSLYRAKENLERLTSSNQQNIRYAQCVDGQEDLTGEVGTIEIPGELHTLKIQPGFTGEAVYSSSRDGILQSIPAGTPASVFYNKSLLPGWQKHMPTYRIGTITSFADRFDVIDFYPWYKYFYYRGAVVQLDDIRSSAQNLNINKLGTITADFEPFKDFDLDFTKILWNTYFDTGNPWMLDTFSNHWYWDYFFPRHADQINLACLNYEIGDKVVIKFENQDWSQGNIIGFENNPPLKENIYSVNIKFTWQGKEYTPEDMNWLYDEFGGKSFWGPIIGQNPEPYGYPKYGGRKKYDSNTGFWKFILDEYWLGSQAWNILPPWNGTQPFENLYIPYSVYIALHPSKPFPDHNYIIMNDRPFFPGYIECDLGGTIFGAGPGEFLAWGKRLLQSKGHVLPLYGHTTWEDVFYDGDVTSSQSLLVPYNGNLIIKDSDGIWHN